MGVNDPGEIPWRTTGWRAGAEDVLPAKVANRAGLLSDKIVPFDRQGTALSENDVDGERPGEGCNKGLKNVSGVNELLTEVQKKEKRQLQQKKYRTPSAASGNTKTFGTSRHHLDHTTKQLAKVAKA